MHLSPALAQELDRLRAGGDATAEQLSRLESAISAAAEALDGVDRNTDRAGGMILKNASVDYSVSDGRLRIEAVDPEDEKFSRYAQLPLITKIPRGRAKDPSGSRPAVQPSGVSLGSEEDSMGIETEAPQGGSSSKSISLTQVESDIHVKLLDAENRRLLVQQMTLIFTKGNIYMWIAIGLFTIIDCVNIWGFDAPHESRIVTTEVLYALVGATVVQLGVIMVAISRNLFPVPTDDDGE